MNQMCFKVKTTLLTFASGLFAAWFFMQFSQFTFAGFSISDISLFWRAQKSFLIYSLPTTKFDESLKISVIEIIDKNETDKQIKFRIENMSRTAVFYSGYSSSNICAYIVKSESREYKEVCECGFGLERQTLLTGESTVFTAISPVDNEKFRVGFYFKLKNDQPARIFWSDEVNLSE